MFSHAKTPKLVAGDLMGTIVAIANQKGGVGKTSVTVNFGLPMAEIDKRCLFLDFDPQRNLTKVLAPELASDEDFLTGNHKASVINMFESTIKPIPYEIRSNVHIIGGNKKLTNINQDNIFNMADSLDLIKGDYDYIFIDCPPSSTLQHAALAVADALLIVTELEKLSVDGVDELITTSRQVKRRLNPTLEILGIVPNFKERIKINVQEEYQKKLHDNYGELLFINHLYKTTKVKESIAVGKTLQEVVPKLSEKFGFDAAVFEFKERLANMRASS
ncbi:Chromosome partitioning protein ParA (plasmid) [Vibrio scophthalmi]|uniref:Chromosome partitioning protein ParA n=2 Tax=Vibrio scophthalmi TaxID=45658 RepID=A0A1C7FJJ5_9VIBR|nr:Chromosome partitioning protein ParA [Vibrio scophthalmi]